MTKKQYKCFICKIIIAENDLNEDGNCPICDGVVKEMCPNDHCHCPHDIVDGVAYCSECGAPMCPICQSHDVSQVSRITGYLSDVSGWNTAKQQELKDRVRVLGQEIVKIRYS